MSNMSRGWSGLNPPQDSASGCFPDFSSDWNSSPASMSHAFNMGYNMVAAWGGRPPSIGEAFTQGTLFAQHAGPSFQNSGPCFPPSVTRLLQGQTMDVWAAINLLMLQHLTLPWPPLVVLCFNRGLLALTCPGPHLRQCLTCVRPLGLVRWATRPVLWLTPFQVSPLRHLLHLVSRSTRNWPVLQSAKLHLHHSLE